MSYDGTTFRVKSKFGVLSIEASELAVIGLNTEEGVVDIVIGAPTPDDRDRVKGTIEYVREGERGFRHPSHVSFSNSRHYLIILYFVSWMKILYQS